MEERRIAVPILYDGTLNENKVWYHEFPFGVTLMGVKAWATNDSDATLQVGTSADADAHITEAVIGDSADPSYLEPSAPKHIAADTLIKFSLDYDGDGGTAAADVQAIAIYLTD